METQKRISQEAENRRIVGLKQWADIKKKKKIHETNEHAATILESQAKNIGKWIIYDNIYTIWNG